MHSEKMKIHIQHMAERYRRGNAEEEKELKQLLFDEVYRVILPILKEENKAKIASNNILKRYFELLPDKEALDICMDIKMYAAVLMYKVLSDDNGIESGEESSEKMQSDKGYEFNSIFDDTELLKIAQTYIDAFDSVRKYKSKKSEFTQMQSGKMIMLVLYGYLGLSVDEISGALETGEESVKNQILGMRDYLIKTGPQNFDMTDSEEVIESKDRKKKGFKAKKKKNSRTKVSREEEMEEPGILEELFPGVDKRIWGLADFALAMAILVIYVYKM